MNDKIEKAIEELLGKITAKSTSDDVLKITQGALNLAHTAAVLKEDRAKR